MQYVLNKLEARVTAFKYHRMWYFFSDKAVYILQLEKQFAYT